jgi:hypothetical protein
VPQNKDLLTIEYYAPEQRVIPEAFLGVRGGAEGFSKNDPIEKLSAVGIYPDEGAQNPLTVNNSINELAKRRVGAPHGGSGWSSDPMREAGGTGT